MDADHQQVVEDNSSNNSETPPPSPAPSQASSSASSAEGEEVDQGGLYPEVSALRRPFFIGDLVWAQLRTHPWWPGKIVDPREVAKSRKNPAKVRRLAADPKRQRKPATWQLVQFFGKMSVAWMARRGLRDYENAKHLYGLIEGEKALHSRSRRSVRCADSDFVLACRQADKALANWNK